MKLHNQTLKHLSVWILAIVTIWSVVFYVNMISEIKKSMDDGLENYKRVLILNAHKDSTIVSKDFFDESFFTINEINKEKAIAMKDRYIDTIVYMQDFDDVALEPEPVRMLISAFEFKGQYYELKVANSMVEKSDMIRVFLWNTVLLYVLLILGIVFINNVVLRKLWHPFYDLLNKLENYRLGTTGKLPEVKTRTKEFKDLQEAVNVLLTENKRVFEQQKQFIGNASHELQTPLAIATHKLELLLEENDLTSLHGEEVTELYNIIQRMVKLNKSLLLLSKIENNQFIDNQLVSINEIVYIVKAELEDYAEFRHIVYTINEHANLTVKMDPALAHIVVSNLLRNAIFYNVDHGTIEVTILDNMIRICNTGLDVPLENAKIFTRFYRPDLSTKGTGLGLAIVKAITDLYGFSVSYDFVEGLHCMEVVFIAE